MGKFYFNKIEFLMEDMSDTRSNQSDTQSNQSDMEEGVMQEIDSGSNDS